MRVRAYVRARAIVCACVRVHRQTVSQGMRLQKRHRNHCPLRVCVCERVKPVPLARQREFA